MKIGIDIRCLAEGRRTGVEEYALNLLHEIFSQDTTNKYILFFNSFSRKPESLDDFKKYTNVTICHWKVPNKILNFLFWYFNWPKIDRMIGGVDIIFFPNITFAAWSAKTQAVITVHDLSFERFSQTFNLKRKLWHFFVHPRKLCKMASKIIAVSESTGEDVQDLYNVEKEKIKVIHSGVAEKFRIIDRNNPRLFEVRKKYDLPVSFILYLGTIEPRKNIAGIIEAYELMRNSGMNGVEKYKLVIAGSPGWMEKLLSQKVAHSKYKEDILFLGFIDESDKAYVYNLARVFIYPSFFEGFGFPPLEAMKCGIPVVTSNCSSLPEVAGELAVIIDPERPGEMATAISEILLDRNFSDYLRKKGLLSAAQFTWRKTANSVCDFWKS